MTEPTGTVVKSLNYSFQTPTGRLEVLSDLSLNVDVGQTVSILGPSGCGKTTLLKCIAGLIELQSGQVEVAGMTPATALASKAIGYAFQDAGLLPWRSLSENILLPVELGCGRPDPQWANGRLDWLLSLTRLTSFRDFLPAQLSGGMKQRAALARALILQPKLLLLDELFGSLDLLTRTTLSAELARIIHAARVPTIIVTHSVEEAVFLGSHVLVLSSLPARVIESVEIGFDQPRAISLLGDAAFLKRTAQCRSLLLESRSIE